eukprot:9514660-Karenia_brevis.AAC.1
MTTESAKLLTGSLHTCNSSSWLWNTHGFREEMPQQHGLQAAGAILCHGTAPSAAITAYEHNTQLVHLMPKWNRMDSGYSVCFGPRPVDCHAYPNHVSHTAASRFAWHYGNFDLGELTCPAASNYEDPHIIGLRMLAYPVLPYSFFDRLDYPP